MRFAIFTQVPHLIHQDRYYSYAPYIKEMNIWLKFADKITIVAPLSQSGITAIDLPYKHSNIDFVSIPLINLLGIRAILRTMITAPRIAFTIFKAMRKADHIHLRCPGNIGLLACFIQILFPKTPKTAKYAGNWDPNAAQPWSYKLQRLILSNTFLTKNMQVLVYGQWQNQSANIKPFFTATYHEIDKIAIASKSLIGPIKFLFVGTLSPGKRPLYALQLVAELNHLGYEATLDFYGDGPLRSVLESHIQQSDVKDKIALHGNQTEPVVRNAYQKSHFLILPSQSEGWPKVVAEAMFWGCLPAATAVSCVPYMLDHGNRGVLLNGTLEADVTSLSRLLDNQESYADKVSASVTWSRKYTLDLFENEIKGLLTR